MSILIFIDTCCAFRKRKISTNVTSSEISVTKWKKFCIEKSFYLVLDTKSFRFLLELTNFCTNAQQVLDIFLFHYHFTKTLELTRITKFVVKKLLRQYVFQKFSHLVKQIFRRFIQNMKIAQCCHQLFHFSFGVLYINYRFFSGFGITQFDT